MSGHTTKLRVRFLRSSFADMSLAVTLFQLVLGLLVLILGLLINRYVGDPATFVICIGLWLLSLGTAIYLSGPRTETTPADTNLRVFHVVPLLMLVVALPSMAGNLDHLGYLMSFVDFIILLALLVYGLICLRNLRWPSPLYWLYLPAGILLFNSRL